jgi:hypothetical protein
MSDQEKWEQAIATYRDAWYDLIRIGVALMESDAQDVDGLKETVDKLSDVQAKELLTVAAASVAYGYVEARSKAGTN